MANIRLVREYTENGADAHIRITNAQRGIDESFIVKVDIIENYPDELSKLLQNHPLEIVREKARNFYYFIIDEHKRHANSSSFAPSATMNPTPTATPTTPTKKVDLPKEVNGYILPDRQARQLLSAVKLGKNIMIVGDAGCGKSRLVQELAKLQGATVERVNLNGGTTDASLVGEKIVMNDNGTPITSFQYGALPRAMKNGAWLLLDEIDFAQPEYLAVLQGVFEGNRTPLIILENGAEKIIPHENFRIIATANTLGRGDTRGYFGTNSMNIATLDRWSIIRMQYTKAEKTLVANIVGKEKAKKIMLFVERVRNAIATQQLPDYVLSTRRILDWANSLNDDTLTFEESTESEITGRLTSEEHAVINEFIRDIFAEELGRI